MISAVLSLVLVVGATLNTGENVEENVPTLNQTIGIQIDAYGFTAVNATAQDHVFVIGYGETRFVRVLPQGTSLAWPIPEGGTRGVTLEILTPGSEGWTTSTPVSIDLQALTGGAPLIMSYNQAGMTAWKASGNSLFGTAVNASSAGLMGTARTASYASTASSSGQQEIFGPTLFHVPSTAGLDNPAPQAPPVIDDNPLPAI